VPDRRASLIPVGSGLRARPARVPHPRRVGALYPTLASPNNRGAGILPAIFHDAVGSGRDARPYRKNMPRVAEPYPIHRLRAYHPPAASTTTPAAAPASAAYGRDGELPAAAATSGASAMPPTGVQYPGMSASSE